MIAIGLQLPNGIVSSVSLVSTTKTARSLADFGASARALPARCRERRAAIREELDGDSHVHVVVRLAVGPGEGQQRQGPADEVVARVADDGQRGLEDLRDVDRLHPRRPPRGCAPVPLDSTPGFPGARHAR